MAPAHESYHSNELDALQHSLKTADLELKYERSTAAIANLSQVEAARKLRLQILFLQDEVDDLNERVWEETERAEDAWKNVDEMQVKCDDGDAELEIKVIELRSKTRELETVKTELASLQDVSADSNKVLTEKLALARELAMLKPELEDLRAQASTHQSLHAEKLALQRDVTMLKTELESKDRRLSLVRAKDGKSSEKDLELESQITDLEKQVTKGNKELHKVKLELDQAKTNLESEKARLKRALSKEGKEIGQDLATEAAVDELKAELVKERRERQKAEKQLSKAESDWEAQRAVLDDKLEQFKTKLKASKTKLKEAEVELQNAQSAAKIIASEAAAGTTLAAKTKNNRKRGAVHMDPDAAIGTPGDAIPAKRARRAPSIVGGKSTFSITPFLKRTASIAPESPHHDTSISDAQDQPMCSIEEVIAAANSPTEDRSKPIAKNQSSILAPASPGKSNPKVLKAAKKKNAKPIPEVVAEDIPPTSAADENLHVTARAPAPAPRAAKPSLKPKSLVSFASFRAGSAQPEQLKKKRRLLGGAKTLFDEDEDGNTAVLGAATGQRAFGAFAGRGFGLRVLGSKAGLKKGPLVTAGDGFTFSPLKRDRKAAAAAAAAAAPVTT